ncbi:Gfo/Idh/MocA family protein [Methylobacterium sp. R2-1]|uniref:Gfo/Idh/MocA family protein n=1 Tax=Methylobacterium sp. R2-1 TaxID=2587064 RepID=UPI00161D9509|nr:Gfo/Idh/MocA family oxidoreductase [Methylobacterium sp. R2-1]
MKIAYVGCGYVFDIYMRTAWAYPEITVCGVFDIDTARSAVVSGHYGFHVYPDLDALLSDPDVAIVVNLTSIRSHYEVTKRALEAGKHVYSEKPITTDLGQTRELFALAAARGLVLTGAPCNLFCDAIATMWKAVDDGAIGKPVLVYAELDDNPAHLMNLESVQSPTGAPFPYAEELQEGCTVEHVGYHLVWLCAMFGPVRSMTAFSSTLVAHKTDTPLDPADTPDLSVGCLEFAGGVSARVTCSWVAPRDHSIRIVGETGEIRVDNVFHDQAAVHLERFSRVSLSARKAYTLRTQPLLGRIFGIGGRRIRLIRRWKSHAVEAERGVGRSVKHRIVSWLRRREVYAQDKLLGIGEMARAIVESRPQPLPPDFLLHLNELTLAIQRAGPRGATMTPTTGFANVPPLPDVVGNRHKPLIDVRPGLAVRWFSGVVEALHQR